MWRALGFCSSLSPLISFIMWSSRSGRDVPSLVIFSLSTVMGPDVSGWKRSSLWE